jgi:integrase/recombinase XerD
MAVMIYTFARVGTVVALNLEDYFPQKNAGGSPAQENGKLNEMPCHHKLKAYLDAYIDTAGITGGRKGPLFRALGKSDRSGKSDVYIRYVV